MKTSKNKNRNLLLFVFFSALLITYITPHTMLIIVTALIGFVLISNLFFSVSVRDFFPNNRGSLSDTDKEISFFDDFNSDN